MKLASNIQTMLPAREGDFFRELAEIFLKSDSSLLSLYLDVGSVEVSE